jgi:hypothetical protein
MPYPGNSITPILKRFSCLSGGNKPPHRKEIPPMHDFLVAGAFLLMVILPCIVTMGAGTAEGEGEEA